MWGYITTVCDALFLSNNVPVNEERIIVSCDVVEITLQVSLILVESTHNGREAHLSPSATDPVPMSFLCDMCDHFTDFNRTDHITIVFNL